MYITYKKPTLEEFKNIHSETGRYRHITAPYCSGAGVDIASQGATVVPWALSYDLPKKEFDKYANGHPPKGPIHLRGHANSLPFDDKCLDFVYSSHYIEDELDWMPILKEWDRVLKVGGHMIILYPDYKLWEEAVRNGQPPNCSHRHRPYVGEMTALFKKYFGHYTIIKDELTRVVPSDYNICFIAKRIA